MAHDKKESKPKSCSGCLLDLVVFGFTSAVTLVVILTFLYSPLVKTLDWLTYPGKTPTTPQWVVCLVSDGNGEYKAAHLVDWRDLAGGARSLRTFDTGSSVSVSRLTPLSSRQQYDRASDAIRDLEERMDSAWDAGPAGLEIGLLVGRWIKVDVFLDDHGSYTTMYRVSRENDVTIVRSSYWPSPFASPSVVLVQPFAVVAGCAAGLVAVVIRRRTAGRDRSRHST